VVAKDDPGKARRVFVVHGRDERLRKGVFDFLRSIHLNPIEWSEAISLTGKASPYVGEVLDTAFRHAQAVLVVLSPDDQAKLRADLVDEHDPTYEKELSGQPRPNVLFEAAMAFASHPDNTALVQIGSVRPFSDVGGRHVIRMDGSVAKRKDLALRLEKAGCAIDLHGDDWLTAGDLIAPVEAIEEAHASDDSGAGNAVDHETYKLVAERWDELKDPVLKEAVRLLLREDLTTKQALVFLHQKGLAMNWAGVYDGIATKTNLVQRALPGRQPDENVYGYTGPWTLNPKFKPALRRLLENERRRTTRVPRPDQ
jgi:predicted nucleotide-binding protein